MAFSTFTSTNGPLRPANPEQAQAIVESGLDEMIVSLDGVDQDTYEKYRVGGQIERVFSGGPPAGRSQRGAGVADAADQLAVHRYEAQRGATLATAESLAKDLRVDKFLVKTAQIYSEADAEEFLPEDEQYSRYERAEDELVVKGQPTRGCKVLWYSSMGQLERSGSRPAASTRTLTLAWGRPSTAVSFDEIWRSRAYMDFRRQVLADRNTFDMCRNCSEGYRGMFSLIKEIKG